MSSAYYLTLLIGPVVPVPVPEFVLNALTEVETQSGAGGPGGFRLVFEIDNKSPLQTFFLLTAGQTPLLRVVVVVTINGVPSVLADGVMTQTALAPGANPGESKITVTGVDLTKAMDLIDFTGFPYPAMPPEVRVAICIAKYAMFGMIPLVIPSLFVDLPLPVDRIPVHQGTDLAYINQLAHDAGYVFYIEPGPVPGTNTAYWGPEIKVGVPQPALSVNMDAATNCESINFTFNTTGQELPIVYVQIPQARVSIPIPVPNINPLQPPLGVIPPIPSTITVLRETAKLNPIAALGRGVATAGRSADVVTGTGSLDVIRYGQLLRARGLVGVRGVGMAYDGLYFVKSVTTTLKQGEIKQSFQLTRNGLVSITPVVPT
jgi:hypothetical protein